MQTVRLKGSSTDKIITGISNAVNFKKIMFILCYIFSIAVSVFLVVKLVGYKKNDPFPKGSVLWMILWGAWSAVFISFFLLSIDEIKAAVNAGSFPILEAFKSGDPFAVKEEIEELNESEPVTFSYLFREAFIEASIPEEIGKYIVSLYFIFQKKLSGKRPIFNSVVCCGLVALGFEMIEDVMYISGDVFVAVLRGVMPLHFCVQVIMGYFIGKAIVSGSRFWHLPALLIPILIHGIYDGTIFALDLSDWILLIWFVVYIFLIALTVGELIILHRSRISHGDGSQ